MIDGIWTRGATKRVLGAAGVMTLLVTPVLAQQSTNPDYSYYHGPGMHWGEHMWGHGLFLGPLFAIIFIAAVVVIVIALMRWISGTARSSTPVSDTALDILKARYARGEIDAAEFAERKRVLGEQAG